MGQMRNLYLRKQNKLRDVDYILAITLTVLLAAGLMVLYSSTRYMDSREHPTDPFYTIKRQILFLALAGSCMIVVMRIDYHRIVKYAKWMYPLSVVLGIAVLFFGREVNGQKRWFAIGPVSFQPAEFAKVTLIVTLTGCYHRYYYEKDRFRLIIRTIFITLPVFLPVVDANLSSGLILGGIAFFMAVIASKKRVFLLAAAGCMIVSCVWLFQSGILAQILDEYQMNRIYAWLDPKKYPLSNGFQVLQGLYAIGAGGIFGTGFGNSIQKLGYLPEAQNDMIFSIICEELGLAGAIFFVILYIILLWRCMVIAVHASDEEGMFLVSGIMIHIAIQVLLNIAVVTNTIPNTGVSLPFVSYGGSSVLFLLVEIGIVFRVSFTAGLKY